jgi:hypothetical protein
MYFGYHLHQKKKKADYMYTSGKKKHFAGSISPPFRDYDPAKAGWVRRFFKASDSAIFTPTV